MGKLIHLSKIVIFCFDIKKTVKALEISEMPKDCKSVDKKNADSIAMFYKSNNYGMYLSTDEVEAEFEKGYEFYGVYRGNMIVAGMWIHSGRVKFDAPSFEALIDKHSHAVYFHDRTIYSSHNFVAPQYRGSHLYSLLLQAVLFANREKADKYIYITGIDNKRMINSGIKFNGQIIGVVYIWRLFKYVWLRRKLYFADKLWESVE